MATTGVKSAHVSTMTDAVIANMSLEGLRAIIRPILAAEPRAITTFETEARKFMQLTSLPEDAVLFTTDQTTPKPTAVFGDAQRRARCLVGCGMPFEGFKVLALMVRQAAPILRTADPMDEALEEFFDVMAVIDGDMILTLTGLNYALWTPQGPRKMTESEKEKRTELREALLQCKTEAEAADTDFVFERAFDLLEAGNWQ